MMICRTVLKAFVLMYAGASMAQDIDPASDPDVQPASPTVLQGYQLAWSDEFSGSAVDETKWIYREGDDTRTFIKSFQTAANNSVSGGVYRCILNKENMGSKEYTAGGIISKKQMRYGYYESRFKCPPTGGWHTSFWMMRYGDFGTYPNVELDVFENDSVSLDYYTVNVHSHQPFNVQYGTKQVSTPDLSGGFYTFGCEYTETHVRYYFDGVLVQTVDATQFDHNDMNVWLTSLALVYSWQEPVDDSQLPVEAQYDYVRFFELGPYATAEITSPDSGGATLTDTNTVIEFEAAVEVFDTNTAATVVWSKRSGPGEVFFTEPSSTNTGVRFSAEGLYEIECAAIIGSITNSDAVYISVNTPRTYAVQQGADGADTPSTFIRQDLPNRNSGADLNHEMIVGHWGGGTRGLLRFDLSGLDPEAVIQDVHLELYNYWGSGTVGEIQLRQLTASFDEGTGDGNSDASGAGTGATWHLRTGTNISVQVSTALGTVTDIKPVAEVTGLTGVDYVYLQIAQDPGSAEGVLTDNRIDTGLLNVTDDAEYHFGQTLTDSDVVTVIYDGSPGAFYDQPGTIVAFDVGGEPVGSAVTIPDLEASSYTSMTLARPQNGSTLPGRSIFGFVLPVADFGGDASDINYIRISSTPDAGQCDMHFIGVSKASGVILSGGVSAVTTANEITIDPQSWASAGGDYAPEVLSSMPGYSAESPGYKTFDSTPGFAAAVQDALDNTQPLDLMIHSPATEALAVNAIARFRSGDAVSADERPKLVIRYLGRYLPEVYAGPGLVGYTSSPIVLNGEASHTDVVEWNVVSGNGSVQFSDASALTNTAQFDGEGRYWLRLNGSNALGEGYQDVSISILDVPPVVSMASISSSGTFVEVNSAAGLTYVLQGATNLTDAAWTDLQHTNALADPFIFAVPAPTNRAEFYRVMVQP